MSSFKPFIHKRRVGSDARKGHAAALEARDHQVAANGQATDKGKARQVEREVQPTRVARAHSAVDGLVSTTTTTTKATTTSAAREGEAVSTNSKSVTSTSSSSQKSTSSSSSTSTSRSSTSTSTKSSTKTASSTSDAAESSSSSRSSTAVSTSVSSSTSTQAPTSTTSVVIVWEHSSTSSTEAVWSASAATSTSTSLSAAASSDSSSSSLADNKTLLIAVIIGSLAAAGVVIVGLLWLCKRSGAGPTKRMRKSKDKFNTGNWSPRSEGSSVFVPGVEIGEAYGDRGNLSFASLVPKHGARDLESANEGHGMNSYATYGGNSLAHAAAMNPILAPVFDPTVMDRFGSQDRYTPFPQRSQSGGPYEAAMNNGNPQVSFERPQMNDRRPSFIQRLMTSPARKSTIDLTQVLEDKELGMAIPEQDVSQPRGHKRQRSDAISARSSQKSHRTVNSLISAFKSSQGPEEKRRSSTWGFRRNTKAEAAADDSDFEGTIGAPDREVPKAQRIKKGGERFTCDENASEAETDVNNASGALEGSKDAWWTGYGASEGLVPPPPAMIAASSVPGRQLLAPPSSTALVKSNSLSGSMPFAELKKQQDLLDQRIAADPQHAHAKLDARISRWWNGSWDAEWPSPTASIKTPSVDNGIPLSPRSMYQSSEENTPTGSEGADADDYMGANRGVVIADAQEALARMPSLRQQFPAMTTLESWLQPNESVSGTPRAKAIGRLMAEAAEPYEGSLRSPVVHSESASECEIDEDDNDYPIQRKASGSSLAPSYREAAAAPVEEKRLLDDGFVTRSLSIHRPTAAETSQLTLPEADGSSAQFCAPVAQYDEATAGNDQLQAAKRLPSELAALISKKPARRLSSAPLGFEYQRPASKQDRRALGTRVVSSAARMNDVQTLKMASMHSDDIAEEPEPEPEPEVDNTILGLGLLASPAASSDSGISVRRWGHSGDGSLVDSPSRLQYQRIIAAQKGLPFSYSPGGVFMATSSSSHSSDVSFAHSSGGRSSTCKDYDEEVRARAKYHHYGPTTSTSTNSSPLRSGSVKLQQQQQQQREERQRQSRVVSSVQAHMEDVRRNREKTRFASGPVGVGLGLGFNGVTAPVSMNTTGAPVRIQY